MNLRHLRTFVAVADAGGFARASAKLHLSQPAASRQIHALEADLRVMLFDRIGRRVHLTSEGEDLLRHSRHLLAEADSLAERARALEKGEKGILRVGATPQVIENTLASFLGAYRRRHPGIEVHLVEDGGNRLPTRLRHGDIQLVLTVAVDDFPQQPLFPVYAVAVTSKSHRLGHRRAIDIGELAEEPLFLMDRTFASRGWWDAACNVAHIRPRVLLESRAPHTIIALAAEGHGIAVVPSTVAIRDGRVRGAPLTQRGSAIGRWLTVGWDPQRFRARYAEQFIEELVVSCRRAHPGREFLRHAPLPQPKEPASRSANAHPSR
ncbi:MAG: LysR family transcriptional regulator [Candidatus Rokubacteria bacterium]|nr:LysR family transcriptional regulator [Candidatus Rokubacteria bacterium]